MVKSFKQFPGVEWEETRSDFITIDKKKCVGCGNCVKVCLAGCFEMVDQKARVKSLDKCMECASCWYICKEGAVNFTWPQGGTGFRSDWG